MSRARLFSLCLVLAFIRNADAQTDAPRVRIVEDLRLDATAEDFPTVGVIYVGPRGEIAVPIRLDQQLRIYSSSGKRLAVVGRKGAGPGEFTAIMNVGWKGDTMWVQDRGQRRASYFGPDYKLLRTETWPPIEARPSGVRVTFFDPFALLPDGSWLGQGLLERTTGGMPPGVLAVRSPDGSMRAALYTPSEDEPRIMWVAGFGRGVPFSLQPQYSFPYDGSRFGELSAPIPASVTSYFTVTVIRATGDTIFSRRYQFRGEPIPRQAKDSALAAMIPPSGRVSEGPPDLPQRFQAMARDRMSSWYIPVETITLGLDQTIWIGLRPTDEGRKTLILNSRGDPIGTVLLPRSSRLRQATASHLWVTETDSDGLTSVVRYRVEGLSCGAVRC